MYACLSDLKTVVIDHSSEVSAGNYNVVTRSTVVNFLFSSVLRFSFYNYVYIP